MNDQNMDCMIKLLDSGECWFDGKSIEQLQHVSKFRGMRRAVAMPDMHANQGAPNGAAFLSEGMLYPHLIGNDIGCGFGLWRTSLLRKKLKLDRWAQRLHDLDQPWSGDMQEWLSQYQLPDTEFSGSMGTIGGGNHFAELQAVDSVLCADTFEAFGLSESHLYLLVHSGSRGLGQSILRQHVDVHRANGVEDHSVAAQTYLEQHDEAVAWAKANRELIARRFGEQINAEMETILDVPHNFLERVEDRGVPYWLHRKGASPSTRGLVMIPGSRGAFSYLVEPKDASVAYAWSLAHGAGRKWDRHSTEKRMRDRFRKEELIQTKLGGRVICESKSLLFQEAPEAYKNIEQVIGHLLDAGLINVVAKFRPLITYKKRSVR
ncbi:MAG: RNA ligase RtcB family protein [Opitutaceae bacterium]